MTSKKTRHALVSSIISLVLCCSMLLGTTFAWFTDTVTSENNIIKSGTLDAEMNWQNPGDDDWKDASTGAIFDYEYWEPGYVDIKNIQLKNVGDLAFKYQLRILPNNANADALKLAEVIDVYVAPVGSVTTRDQIDGMQRLGTLKDLMAQTTGVDDGVLLPSLEKRPQADRDGQVVDPTVEFYAGEVALTLALKMQEQAGNEYQDLSIGGGFTVQLLASQFTWEKDSFDHEYDGDSSWPVSAIGTGAPGDSAPEDPTFLVYIRDVTDTSNNPNIKRAVATVPKSAADPAYEKVTFTIAERSLDRRVTVGADQGAKSFDISASGIVSGNTEDIKMELYVGEGLTDVKIYHNDELINDASYDPYDGYVTFCTDSFSPFTLLYAADAGEFTPEPTPKPDEGQELPEGIPVATVVEMPEHVGVTLPWGAYGEWSPSDMSQTLECAFKFTAPHTEDTIADCAFKDWTCDYYVKMDRDVPVDALFLGGMYGVFGWVGFENPVEVAANEEIGLLEAVVTNAWTYEEIALNVGEFVCGVARSSTAGTDLDGATFTVMLRLTNPEDSSEFYNVNVVTHTFQ